jgi:hypothetical protein
VSLVSQSRTVVALSSTRKASSSSESGSRSSPTRTERVCIDHVGRWLARGFTGCRFAASFASANQMLFSAFDDVAQPDQLDDLFDSAAAVHLPAVVILPTIRTESDLLEQLAVLAQGERWRVTKETVANLATDDLLLGIQWKTSAGRTSLPMGFGPFATMPVTRRAPYACLATWPGEHENRHRTRYEEGVVDFLDSAPAASLSKPEYRKLWDASTARTGELLSDPADDAGYYRRVAFRLSPAAARQFRLPG